jgi:hypothetical protein
MVQLFIGVGSRPGARQCGGEMTMTDKRKPGFWHDIARQVELDAELDKALALSALAKWILSDQGNEEIHRGVSDTDKRKKLDKRRRKKN